MSDSLVEATTTLFLGHVGTLAGGGPPHGPERFAPGPRYAAVLLRVKEGARVLDVGAPAVGDRAARERSQRQTSTRTRFKS